MDRRLETDLTCAACAPAAVVKSSVFFSVF